jgi:hypothetical protein
VQPPKTPFTLISVTVAVPPLTSAGFTWAVPITVLHVTVSWDASTGGVADDALPVNNGSASADSANH